MASKYEESLRNIVNIHNSNPGLIELAYVYGSYIAMGYDIDDFGKYYAVLKKESKSSTVVLSIPFTAKNGETNKNLREYLAKDIELFVSDELKITGVDKNVDFRNDQFRRALKSSSGNLRKTYLTLLKYGIGNKNISDNFNKLMKSNDNNVKLIGALLGTTYDKVNTNKVVGATILDFEPTRYDELLNDIEPNPLRPDYYNVRGNKNDLIDVPPMVVSGKDIEEVQNKVSEVYIELATKRHDKKVDGRNDNISLITGEGREMEK